MKKLILICGTTALFGTALISPVHADQARAFFTDENIGRVVGTSLGALLGSEIGSGRGNDIAIAAGAVGGYVLGGKVGRDWRSGNQGSYSTRTGYQQPVTAIPELDHIDRTYRTTRTSNVRGGPSTRYVIVGGLQPGEEVQVLGRVLDRNWYLIAQDDIIQGFVHTSLLRPIANEYYSHNSLMGQSVTGPFSPLPGQVDSRSHSYSP